jgi:SAM-dependent methyltransferase
MLSRIKSIVARTIKHEREKSPSDDWVSHISIRGDSSPYENLPPVAHCCDEIPWINFDGVRLERDLRSYVAEDTYPLPSTRDRESYHGQRHYDYWLSGLRDYLCIKQALAKQGFSWEGPLPILDLGCASGRVLRHFLCHEDGLALWGADINLRHVEWIRRFLEPSLRVFQNTTLPSLPLEDNAFSLVYAFSVFTHIDVFELAWLVELRRILKPRGVAYLTIHSEQTWERMGPTRTIYNDLLAAKDYVHEHTVTPEMFREPMPSDRVVFRWRTALVDNVAVFHSIDYIKNVWGRFFEIVDVVHEGHDYQDVVVLRKC